MGGTEPSLPWAHQSLGCSRVQAGPVDLMGQERDPGSGVRAGVQPGNAALVGALDDAVCLAQGRLAPRAIQGATAQHIPMPEPSWCRAPPRLAP